MFVLSDGLDLNVRARVIQTWNVTGNGITRRVQSWFYLISLELSLTLPRPAWNHLKS